MFRRMDTSDPKALALTFAMIAAAGCISEELRVQLLGTWPVVVACLIAVTITSLFLFNQMTESLARFQDPV